MSGTKLLIARAEFDTSATKPAMVAPTKTDENLESRLAGPEKPRFSEIRPRVDQSVRLQSRIPPVLINRCAWDSLTRVHFATKAQSRRLGSRRATWCKSSR